MSLKYFLKAFSRKIFIYFSMITFIAAALFVTGGCEKSDYEKAISGEDSASDIQTSTIEQINETEETGSDETKNTYTESSSNSSITEQTAASETTDNDITDDNMWKFTEKSSKVKSLGRIFF